MCYGNELFSEKTMVSLRFCFNNCIFFQRTIISLLSSYKQGGFGGCMLEPVVHFKTTNPDSLGSFSGMLTGTKAYLRLDLGCIGSHSM